MRIRYKKFVLTWMLMLPAFVGFCQSKKDVQKIAEYSFEVYKQIHKYPELGKKEYKTSALIKKELQEIGFTEFYTVPGLPTCIIAGLGSNNDGPVVALRAELDARPGKENTNLSYASKTDTTNHSCGHDAHAAILLGTAKLLYQQNLPVKGKVYFIFQPAEETKGGADDIVNSGILDSLKIDAIFALHSVPGMTVGNVSVSPGFTMAGSNYFTIDIKGQSSHAATPYSGSNLPVLTSRVVQLISSIPARKMDISMRPSVISPTYIEVGDKRGLNVLSSTATIMGTIRAYEQIDQTFQGQPSIQEILTKEVVGICRTQNATCTVSIRKGSPPTYNNDSLFNTTIPRLKKSFSGVIDTSLYKGMFSEDFSYYTGKVPCLYFGLGVAKGELGYSNVHSNEFSVHPETFSYGIELFRSIVNIHAP